MIKAEWTNKDTLDLQPTCNQFATDCISRQAAIDALCDEYCGGWQDCKHYPKCENLKAIQNLPSAHTEKGASHERKLIKWQKRSE